MRFEVVPLGGGTALGGAGRLRPGPVGRDLGRERLRPPSADEAPAAPHVWFRGRSPPPSASRRLHPTLHSSSCRNRNEASDILPVPPLRWKEEKTFMQFSSWSKMKKKKNFYGDFKFCLREFMQSEEEEEEEKEEEEFGLYYLSLSLSDPLFYSFLDFHFAG